MRAPRAALVLVSIVVTAGPRAGATCSFPDPDALLAERELMPLTVSSLPTNAFLFRSTFRSVPAWRAEVRRDGEALGVQLEGAGGRGVQGQLALVPNSAYTLLLWNRDDDAARAPRVTLALQSGDGPDVTAPDAPEIVDTVVHEVVPDLGGSGECGGTVPPRAAATTVEWNLAGVPAVHALLFDLDTDAENPVAVAGVTRDPAAESVLSFSTGDSGVRRMGFVLEDIAGNTSEMTVVDADFGGPGSCAQPPLGPSLLALVALRRRNLRRRAPRDVG